MANQTGENHPAQPPVAEGKARFFKVASFSQEGKTYLIRQLPTGEWKCNCPNFVFNENRLRRQGKSTKCDHILHHQHLKLKHHGRKNKK